MLNVEELPIFDDAIENIEVHTYNPYNNNFSNNDEIRICINQQDSYVLPCDSNIYIEGTVLKKKNGEVSSTVDLINNCCSFLFNDIRYELNGMEIDHCKNVGITTCMKSYISFDSDTYKSASNAGWSLTGFSLKNGQFNFCIPLKHLLGFSEDYRKIIINAKHELILNRKTTDLDCVNIATKNADSVEFTLNKVQWRMPHIQVGDEKRLELLKYLEREKTIQMCFRSWDIYEYPTLPTTTKHLWTVKTSSQLEKPRYVIVGLQTSRKNQIDLDASVFDHCNISDIKVYLNSKQYPYESLNLNFISDKFSLLYDMYTKFQNSYYNRDPKPWLTKTEFKSIAPLFVFDCSRQNDSIKTATVDIRLEIDSVGDIPDHTAAYCLLIHDRIIEYTPLTNFIKKII